MGAEVADGGKGSRKWLDNGRCCLGPGGLFRWKFVEEMLHLLT